ncbi:MAG: hypothetical protein ABII79_12050 [bacterium]
MSDLHLYSVNWQDGMLVTQQHLKDQEKYFQELARWHALTADDRYGLVRKTFSGRPALSLNLSASSNRLGVEVVRCQALTPDGGVIEINESNHGSVTAEMDVEQGVVPVFIGIDPTARKEVGDPDPADDLPRIPYLVNSYRLALGRPPQVPEGSSLQIAQVIVDGSEVTADQNYFPPCLTLAADERLSKKTLDFHNRLEKLLSLSSQAYKAVAAGGVLAGEQTDLQTAFKETIFQFAYHLSSTLDELVVGRNAQHPLHLVVFFKKLFRAFTTLLNLRPGLKDFLNERFFVKQANTEVGRFMSMVDGFLMAEYNHRDLGGHLSVIDEILGQVRGIMGFLAQVKKEDLGQQAVATDTLTYQGRTYRIVEYGGTRLEQVGELAYLLIDIPEPCPISDTVILIAKDLFSSGEWSSMLVRLGLNDARGLGETDPIEVDVVTFENKIALRPQDMLRSPAVRQVTLIFRGAPDAGKFTGLGKSDLIVYAM